MASKNGTQAKIARATTTYVVLRQDGTKWAEFASSVPASSGVAAIKAATKQDDGSFAAGRYRAVSESTWGSESNNLEIKTEVRPVSLFSVPKTPNGSAA